MNTFGRRVHGRRQNWSPTQPLHQATPVLGASRVKGDSRGEHAARRQVRLACLKALRELPDLPLEKNIRLAGTLASILTIAGSGDPPDELVLERAVVATIAPWGHAARLRQRDLRQHGGTQRGGAVHPAVLRLQERALLQPRLSEDCVDPGRAPRGLRRIRSRLKCFDSIGTRQDED